MARMRADTACWVTPSWVAAAFRLPVPTTACRVSRDARSGIRGLSTIARGYKHRWYPGYKRRLYPAKDSGPTGVVGFAGT